PHVHWLNFQQQNRIRNDASRRAAIAAQYEQYRREILRDPFCVVLWQTEVEARWTAGGKYAASGAAGQSDIFGIAKPTGRAIFPEGKREVAAARQTPLQVIFESIVWDCGGSYGIYRNTDEFEALVRRELLLAERAHYAIQAEAERLTKEEHGTH
ncbi:MAG: hypothetical protein AAFU79_01260, partial [Myxococcota bacterium]